MTRLSPRALSVVFLLLLTISCQKKGLPEMVFIQGGEFVMGCDSLGDADESPAHKIAVQSFYIGKYEVTQAEWSMVMRHNPSKFIGENLPVECVSWDDVQIFIAKLNRITGRKYRLPTEAEWEYVAKCGYRSSTTSEYLSSIGWWAENSEGQTHQVGELQPNTFGVYDMIGNVHEFCADFYDSLAYAKTARLNPNVGVSQTKEIVARGGNWVSERRFMRITNRNHAPLDYKNPTVGFRLAMDAENP